MMRFITLLSILLTLVFATGCATMADVARSKDEGTTKMYPVSSDQAWEIAKTVLRWEGCDAIEEHRADGYMLTSSGMNLISYGSVVGVWVDPIDQGRSNVTCVTKRRVATNLATTLTETTFHNSFAKAVEIVKTGNKLPVNSPK